MRSDLVIPVQEGFLRLERVSVRVVRAEPALDFPVALRVFNACFDVLDPVRLEKGAETRVRVEEVTRELGAVVADHLLDRALFHRFFQAADARGRRSMTAFDEREHFPARIVFDGIHPLSSLIEVPIDMHGGECVPALVAHAGRWPACFLRLSREAEQEEYLVDAIMPYLHVVVAQDDARQGGCAHAISQPSLTHECHFPLRERVGRPPCMAADHWRLAKALVLAHHLVDAPDAHTPDFTDLIRRPTLILPSDSFQKLPSSEFHAASYLTEGK